MKKDFKRALSKILAGAMLITSSFSSVVTVAAEESGSTGDSVVFQNDLKSIKELSVATPAAIDGGKIKVETIAKGSDQATIEDIEVSIDETKGLVFGANNSAGTQNLTTGKATLTLDSEAEAGWIVDVVIHASRVTNATVLELKDKSGNPILALNQGGKWNTYKPGDNTDVSGTVAVTDSTMAGQATWRLNLGGDANAANTTRFLSKKTDDGKLAVWSDNTGASTSQGTTNFRFILKKDKTLQIFSGANFEQELGVTKTTGAGTATYGNALTAEDFKNTSTSLGQIVFEYTNSKLGTLGFADVKVTKLEDKVDPEEPTTSSSSITTSTEDQSESTSSEDSSQTTTSSEDSSQTTTSSEDSSQTTTSSETASETSTSSETASETSTSSETASETTTEAQKYDMAEAADPEKVADDNEAASSTTSKKFLLTGDGTVVKNESGSVTLTAPESGSSKLVAKFPKVYTDGTVTFETKVNLGEAFATANQGIVELWGTGNASGKEVLAVRVADGQYQFSVLGTKHGVADFKAGETDVKIAVNLKEKTAECYINGTKVADENGPVTLAESTIAAITEISHAAYFAKNGSATEILSMAVAHQADEQPPVPVTGSGLKSEVAPVGDANLDDLKAGDKIAVTYSLDDEIAGINNYTMFINFDPTILTFDSAEKPADPYTGYVTYNTTTALGILPLVPGDLIEAQANVKTGASNPDYAGTKVPATADTTAAQVGRIKLAAVAGLNGASTNKEDSANVATTAGGKLFTIYFTVKEGTKGGSTTVSLDPVAGSKANELFFEKPVDGQGSSPVNIGTAADVEAAVNENVVKVPVKVDAFEYTYEGDGVKIVIDAEGKVTVEGDNVEGLNGETMTITLKKDTISPADFIAHMAAATQPEGVTVTDASEGDVKKVTITKGDKSVTFIIAESEKGGEVDPPTPGGDVTLTVDGIEIGLKKGDKGLIATVARGKAVEVEGGAYVPLVGGTKTLAELTSADFTGATVDYDAATATATLTVDGTSYKLELFKFGDVNNDTFVNVNDALQAVASQNGEVELTEKQKLIADVNVDTYVNVNDALKMVGRQNDASTEFEAEAAN